MITDQSWQYVPYEQSRRLMFMGIQQGISQYAWLTQPDGSVKLTNVNLENKSHWAIAADHRVGCSAFSVAELGFIIKRSNEFFTYTENDMWYCQTPFLYPGSKRQYKSAGRTEAEAIANAIIRITVKLEPYYISKLNRRIARLFYLFKTT